MTITGDGAGGGAALTESSGGDVSSHQDTVGGLAELVQHVVAILLVLISVDAQRLEAHAADGACYVIHLEIANNKKGRNATLYYF